MQDSLLKYILRLGDNALILGHRLSEWCGHGPILEQDIALINISLDFVGQARNWYTLASQIDGKGKTEDDYAYLRTVTEYYNVQLVEQPNGHWGDSLMRQFYFDVFNYEFYSQLVHSSNAEISSIAQKSLKEITYHKRFSKEWILRLGDGTEESHAKIQTSANELWTYTGELFLMDEIDQQMIQENIGVDLSPIKEKWLTEVRHVFDEATLVLPTHNYMQKGGKQGIHSEHLGHILSDLQYMQRAYPGVTW